MDRRYFVSSANSLYTLWYVEEAFSFISTGSLGNQYMVNEPEKYHFIKSLSKDYDTAVSKAKKYVSDKDGGVLDSICEEKQLEEYSTATTGKKYKLRCESDSWIKDNQNIVDVYRLAYQAMKKSISIRNAYQEATIHNEFTDWSIIKDDEYLDTKLVQSFIKAQALLQSFGKNQWGTYTSMVGAIVGGNGQPTDAQNKFINNLYDNYKNNYEARLVRLNQIRQEQLDYLASCNAVPTSKDRITLIGQIQKTKLVTHQYGSTYKMILLSDEGYKLYGSIPNTLLQDYDISEMEGLRITFDATVEQSDGDKYFGFFKRPTKLRQIVGGVEIPPYYKITKKESA